MTPADEDYEIRRASEDDEEYPLDYTTHNDDPFGHEDW